MTASKVERQQRFVAAYRAGFEKARALGHDHRTAHEWGAVAEQELRRTEDPLGGLTD